MLLDIRNPFAEIRVHTGYSQHFRLKESFKSQMRRNLREGVASNEEHLGGVPPREDLPMVNHGVNILGQTEFSEFQMRPLSNNEATSLGEENIPWLCNSSP